MFASAKPTLWKEIQKSLMDNTPSLLKIYDQLLDTLPEAQVNTVMIGAFWTAAVIKYQGELRCGLASSLKNTNYEHARKAAVQNPGSLNNQPALEIARLIYSESHTETAIGIAVINALLQLKSIPAVEMNAEQYILDHAKNGNVAIIGHFPFINRIRGKLKNLWVLELNPQDGDLLADKTPEILPQADLVAITSTTLINKTYDSVVNHCRADAVKMLLGPSTPLSPLIYTFGIDVLSGTLVEDIDTVLNAVSQGANFVQLKEKGVRLVTMQRIIK